MVHKFWIIYVHYEFSFTFNWIFLFIIFQFLWFNPKGGSQRQEQPKRTDFRGGGGKYGNAGKGKCLPGSLATWRDREIGGEREGHNYYCYYNVIKKIFIFLSLAGAHDRFLWNAWFLNYGNHIFLHILLLIWKLFRTIPSVKICLYKQKVTFHISFFKFWGREQIV